MSKLFSIGEVSTITQAPKYKIAYLIETGKIKKPLEISKRRMFTKKDINQIKKVLERRKH